MQALLRRYFRRARIFGCWSSNVARGPLVGSHVDEKRSRIVEMTLESLQWMVHEGIHLRTFGNRSSLWLRCWWGRVEDHCSLMRFSQSLALA